MYLKICIQCKLDAYVDDINYFAFLKKIGLIIITLFREV